MTCRVVVDHNGVVVATLSKAMSIILMLEDGETTSLLEGWLTAKNQGLKIDKVECDALTVV